MSCVQGGDEVKIVLTGSRSLTNFEAVQAAFLVALQRAIGMSDVAEHEYHHGGAIGADSNMDRYLQLCQAWPVVHLPDYDRYGKGAPHVRNDEMLAEKPHVVIAIWDGTNGGTRSVIEKAARNFPVVVEIVWAGSAS